MKTMLRLIAAGVLALSISSAADARPFAAKDMVTLDRLSDPRVSPDGRFVLYSRRVADYDANKAKSELWLIDLSGKTPAAPRMLDASTGGGVSSARWGADGHSIYFLSSRSGSMQVWRADVAATGASQVTKLPFDVGGFKTSPDGKTLAVAMAVFPDCPTLQCTADRDAARAAKKTTGVVYDKLFIRHWDEWADGKRNHLFVLTFDEKGIHAENPVAIMQGFDGDAPSKPFGDESEFTFSPDGKQVTFSARLAGTTEPWSTNFDLYVAPADGSAAPKNVTEANKAWDTGLVISPDGKLGAYRAMKRPGFEADRWQIMIRDEATGQARALAADWDRSADTLAWSPDGKTLYATAGDVGQTRLFAIDVKSGKVTPLTGPGHVSAFDVSKKGIVYTQDTLAGPAQVFMIGLKGGKPVQLTNANADKLAGVEFGDFEQFSFPGWNGETVHGYRGQARRLRGREEVPGRLPDPRRPAGQLVRQQLVHYRWNPQTYAGAGYAVVMIDFHGSTGYGQAFTDSISQHWGDRPLEDLQKGWAYALQSYSFLDGGRACALGGSYGGYMVNWIAGNWKEPWKCLVNHDGVFDTRFMAYSTEELWFTEWENGGTPWTPGAAYSTFNPANHVRTGRRRCWSSTAV
jgi:dipeptidyl aminopeptidase/acylaminoacyl peptidase